MKKNLLKLLLLSIPTVLFSQGNNFPPPSSSIQLPTFSTPEVSKLFRYSDFPNIGSIGGTSIEIPIYTIKLDGLEVPIVLKYDTKGVKVADIANDVGLGWSLIYGGNIVNEIRDLDDFYSTYNFFDPYCHDFEGYMSEKDYRLSKGYLVDDFSYTGAQLDYQVDSSPDFYLINAPGLNDKFYLKPSVSGGELVPHFLENKNSQSVATVLRSLTSVINTRADIPYNIYGFANFKIKNGLGYEYFFNDPQGTAINFSPWTWNDNVNLYPASVNSWRLSEIKSPYSAKKITYVFENFTNNYLNPTLNANIAKAPTADGDGGLFFTGTDPNTGGGGTNNKIIYTYNLSNKRIKSINFDEGSINFIYTDQRLDYDGNTLNKINVVDKIGNIIKSFDLTYSYFQPSNTANCTDNYTCLRLRLDNIKDSSSGNYTFNYGSNNSNGVFPKRTSSKVDFLGFFNNNSTDFQFFQTYQQAMTEMYPYDKVYYYPQLQKDNYLPFQLNNFTAASQTGTVDRSSNESSLIGLLTNISYPTGGSLSIQYENDDFNYEGSTYKLGTARIKKFVQNFNDGTNLEKNYKYKLADGKSSGQIAFFNPNKAKLDLEINNAAYVLYSNVEEAITGNGKTISEYSNFNDYPDLLGQFDFNGCSSYVYNSPPCSVLITNAEITALKETKFPYVNTISQKHRRGLMTKKTIKDESNIVISKEILQYENYVKDSMLVEKLVSNYNEAGPPVCNGDERRYTISQKNYIRNENSFLTKVIKESYLPNGMVSEESNYTYNEPYNLMTTNQNIVSNGKVTETKYQYPVDLNQTWLTGKNILGIPLITTQTFKNNITDQGKLLSKTETVYPTSSGTIAGEFALPLSSKSYNLDNSQQTDIVYDKYDSKGNLLQYTTKEGIPVTIIWGYSNTQPIAKIEGAFYNDIKDNAKVISIINASINDLLDPNNEGALIISLDNLRTDDTFKDYQITTYSYDPLIGITSVTPPSGIRQVYIYDTTGKLKEIREMSKTGNLLKEFKYKYKNQ